MTMRAVLVTDHAVPPDVVRRPRPEPAADEVLVRIEASGLCHTDLHVAAGDWPAGPSLPLVLGHEGVGIVEAAGTAVPPGLLGSRVVIPWTASTCLRCDACVSGQENRCASGQATGFARDGTHAEYAAARAAFVEPVPDGVPASEAAPLACAGVTAYAAVLGAGQVRAGQTVAVVGVGGLGHLAVQYAALAGARVVAVDVDPGKLDLAARLGADVLVDAAREDAGEALQRLGGAHVVVVLAATGAAYRSAPALLATGGRLVLVALPREDELPLSVFDTVARSLTVVGSSVGTRAQLREVLRLQARGRTRVVVETRPLDAYSSAARELAAGTVLGRLVLVP